jgi:SAM-dependent methyltransferase
MESALTDRRYWDDIWQLADEQTPEEVPEIRVDRDLYQAFIARILRAYLRPGRRFLEVGAGGSAWPGWVASRLGAEAWGIDFSRAGLALAARAVRRDEAPVVLVEGDLFDRGKLPQHAFDVVFSGGFVEHFPEPAPLTERFAELVAPDGVVVTTVPNLDGLNGFLQARVDPDCFGRHVVHRPETLDAAHALGGLEPVIPARFVGVVDLGAVNYARRVAGWPKAARALLWKLITQSRRLGEAAARAAGRPHGGRWFSPSLIGVYRRPPA